MCTPPECITLPVYPPDRISPLFLEFFTEKNSDGTKSLILQGNDLYPRIGQRVEDENVIVIVEHLNLYQNIVVLNLAYNSITDEGLEYLIKNFLCLENSLEELNLMMNDITHVGIESLSSLGEYLTLRSLRLNGNQFGPEGGRLLSLLLAQNSTIELLDVAETNQTLSSMAYIIPVIREDQGFNRTLRVLDISRVIPNYERHTYDSEHLAESLGLMLKVNTTLVELHCQKNQITAHDVEAMLHGMKYNKTLLFLDLGYNLIGDMGIELLGNYFRTRTDMLGLNVAGNSISNTGARALSFTMPFSKLRLLDISYNHITGDGIVDILNTIKKPYYLRYLCMWGNTFSNAANRIIHRMILSTVLVQEYLDVKVYKVDGVYYAARYPADCYKHKYYCLLDYGCPLPVKILQKTIDNSYHKVDFNYYPKLPV